MEALNNLNLILSVVLKLILLVVLVVSVIEFIQLSKSVRKFISDVDKFKNKAEYVLSFDHLQNIAKLFVELNAKTLLVSLINKVTRR